MYKTQNNNVLVEIDLGIEVTKGMMLDMTFNPELFPPTGIVRSVPENLINARDVDGAIDQDNHMEWVTDINIKEGDVVIFDYLTAITNLGWKLRDFIEWQEDWGRWLIIEGKLHIFINYSDLYLRIRGGEYETLNGYVIIKPSKIVNAFVGLEDRNLRTGTCMFSGKANKSYFDEGKHIAMPKEGEAIIFMDFANIKLVPKFYKMFESELWVTPGNRIIGMMN